MTTTQIDFLNLLPINQLHLLNNISTIDKPLITNYCMFVLSTFRRHLRKSISPFTCKTRENEEYYKFRLCLDLDSLSYRAYMLVKSWPYSSSSQQTLIEWLENMIIQCIDGCPWTAELQKTLDLYISNSLLDITVF